MPKRLATFTQVYYNNDVTIDLDKIIAVESSMEVQQSDQAPKVKFVYIYTTGHQRFAVTDPVSRVLDAWLGVE